MTTEYRYQEQQAEEKKRANGFRKGNYVMKRTETDSNNMYTYVRTIPKITHATKGAFPEKRCEIEKMLDGERVIEEVNVKDICHVDQWCSAHLKQKEIASYWSDLAKKPARPSSSVA